jgi:hypothetical protein
MFPILRQIKPKTRAAIQKSIEIEGFRNPILVYATSQGLLLGFGGGRLQAAREIDVSIPAIVVDYTGEFDGKPRVTPENWADFFTDVPSIFNWFDDGIETHYGLEAGRADAWYDPAGIEWVKDYVAETGEAADFITDESPWLDGA